MRKKRSNAEYARNKNVKVHVSILTSIVDVKVTDLMLTVRSFLISDQELCLGRGHFPDRKRNQFPRN